MDERIIDVDGNEIIISVDGVDDIEIADISFEDAEDAANSMGDVLDDNNNKT